MSRASSLYRVQTLDTELDRRGALLQEIETVLSDSHATARSREALAKAETRLLAARLDVRTAETSLEAQRVKIEEVERPSTAAPSAIPKVQGRPNEVESSSDTAYPGTAWGNARFERKSAGGWEGTGAVEGLKQPE
jgi:hypothetical protein